MGCVSVARSWCPYGYTETGMDVCMKFIGKPELAKNWTDAQASCRIQQGELASIRSSRHKVSRIKIEDLNIRFINS